MFYKSKLFFVFAAILSISSCGGGGSANQVTPPTATIASSASSAYQGDNVTINWSSTNATSCTASGAWSNTISTTGSQSTPASALGSNVFTLTCANGNQTVIVQTTVTTTVKPYFCGSP